MSAPRGPLHTSGENCSATHTRAEAAKAQADRSSHEALIAYFKLEIEKLRRQIYGQRSERTARLLDQMELQLEEVEASATEDELAAVQAPSKTTVRSFQRKRPVRKLFPDNIERERVVIAAPTSCPCCGGSRLSKLGEDITETLEEIPRRFKVIETVREKFSWPGLRGDRPAAGAVPSGRNCWPRSCSTSLDNICR